jgi:hypothetical protein
MDEDEYAALHLPVEEDAQCWAAVQQVLALAAANRLPR